jgi:hypothetical protein
MWNWSAAGYFVRQQVVVVDHELQFGPPKTASGDAAWSTSTRARWALCSDTASR